MTAATSRVETFSVTDFEAALHDAFPRARCLGLRQKEYVWVVPVVADATVGVIVRSSIREDGVSAPAGADSIRAWIGRIPDGEPWAPKLDARWVTRRAGWGGRLHRTIADLVVLAGAIRPCPACGAWMKLGREDGKLQLRCDARGAGKLWFDGAGFPMRIIGQQCGTSLPVADGGDDPG
jgi:hypothetical protein